MNFRSRASFAGLAAALVAGCSVNEDGSWAGPARNRCRAEAGQAYVGQIAMEPGIGIRMLRATGARQLRWVPPGSIVTLEYAYGRLTVEYDMAMRITRVACG